MFHLPKGRTEEFAIFRACERFGILPPLVELKWEDCSSWIQAMLIAYDQIRCIEEIDNAFH